MLHFTPVQCGVAILQCPLWCMHASGLWHESRRASQPQLLSTACCVTTLALLCIFALQFGFVCVCVCGGNEVDVKFDVHFTKFLLLWLIFTRGFVWPTHHLAVGSPAKLIHKDMLVRLCTAQVYGQKCGMWKSSIPHW